MPKSMRGKFKAEEMGKEAKGRRMGKMEEPIPMGFPEVDGKGYPKAGHEMKMPKTRQSGPKKTRSSGASMKATVDSTGE
jgi:hypothetical protein